MPEINSVAGQLVGIPVGQVYTAGPGIKIDNVNKVVSVDETVLWDYNGTRTNTFNLSESMSNFEYCRFKIHSDQGYKYDFIGKDAGLVFTLFYTHGEANAWSTWLLLDYTASTNNITVRHSKSISHSFTANSTTLGSALDTHKNVIIEVVGINRISA